ncbi:MAG: methyltransferase domain-containing protein [Deltaproteobacteria bacterium]|nr:methyltransferase domain-containing protein [Deltaproteobacteria bacterium]
MTAGWDAKAYHQVSEPQFAWGKKVLERLSLRGDETVVDAGCGTGRLTALLLERLPRGRVIAVDRDAGMIAEARLHLAPFGDRVDCRVHDLLELPAFGADAIFSTATFHWITDHDTLFRRLFAALKPGGVLVAQCGGGRNLSRVLSRLAPILAEPELAPFFAGAPTPWRYAGPDDTRARLTAAGFVDVEAWLTSAPTPFPDRDSFRRFVDRVILGQRLAPLAGPTRERVVDRIVELSAQDDPPFVLDYVRLDLGGRRPNA